MRRHCQPFSWTSSCQNVFALTYIGADGEEHRPVMIHRGVISTMERFTAILIETYKGAFPTWLAPTQVTMIPISVEAHLDYAWKVAKELQDRGVRVHVDERNEKMQYKIRPESDQQIPYQLIVGDKEMEDNAVNVRRYGSRRANSVCCRICGPYPSRCAREVKTS